MLRQHCFLRLKFTTRIPNTRAAVLESVRVRYSQELVYTYSGLVLIAMNPFRSLNVYSRECMRLYAGRSRNELEPHLFAIAEEAYRKMIDFSQNQSIIVSGESGAGKTQSAKYVMRYFATVFFGFNLVG